jgi:hypothetical protein
MSPVTHTVVAYDCKSTGSADPLTMDVVFANNPVRVRSSHPTRVAAFDRKKSRPWYSR